MALAATLVSVALVASIVAPAAAQTPSTPRLELKAASFAPGLGEAPDIPPGLAISSYAPGTRGYYVVQFDGPVGEPARQDLEAIGAEVLDYLPEFAFKVRMTPAQALTAEALTDVAWVGVFHPAYKLDPAVQRRGTGLYRVLIARGADPEPAAAQVAEAGAQVLRRDGRILVVAANGQRLEAVANVLDVAWIENFALREKHNEFAAGEIMGAAVAGADGFDGSTQTVAVADTGLGGGTAGSAHPDIASSRVTAILDWPGADISSCLDVLSDGAQDVDSGHGTHVALSALGGGGPGGEGTGAAPAASLVFQAVEDYSNWFGFCGAFADGYYLVGIPDDIGDLFRQAYDQGARIHSNSWGSSTYGDYTLDSQNADDFVWNNPDLTITFSAGNDGSDANRDGVVDDGSVGSPATAKNVITVGASENDRLGDYACDTGLGYPSRDAYQDGLTCLGDMGGNNLLGTWGERYPGDFPAAPLAGDATAGDAEQMASWSSRGPTDDGRIKPDVVAPGTWILSGYSGLYQEGYGDPVNPRNGLHQWDGWGMPYGESHKYMGGTSMSNPLTAGAAAVVRDFYDKAHGGHAASAALVKATLINAARDMLDENNDGVDDNDYPIPNSHEGWGRVDLAGATDGSREFVDQVAGLGTGGSVSYRFEVASAGAPFKVTLAWSDFPSTASASKNLVNDLDLVVTAPGGDPVYRGNVFSGGWSQSGGAADRVNNVENVYVASAAAGTWTVEVEGFNVPRGPQSYALVLDGGVRADDMPTLGGSATGLDLQAANCRNQTTGQSVRVVLAPGDTSWDCAAAGLTFDPGDIIVMNAGGDADTASQPLGGSVTGVGLEGVVCRNQTIGQTVQVTLQPGDTSWDCEAAGLSVGAGDRVVIGVVGATEGTPEAAGGSVTGVDLETAICRNQTSGQSVQVTPQAGESSWDCEAAGLGVDAGDVVVVTAVGLAQGAAEPVGGSVTRIDLKLAVCRNLSTQQTAQVSLQPGDTSWDCEAAGLVAASGERIVFTAGGPG